jgi:hypothetical protein
VTGGPTRYGKGESTVDSRQIVEAKLAEAGIRLSAEDVAELVRVYPKLQMWRATVQGLLDQESEPAVTFGAARRGAR